MEYFFSNDGQPFFINDKREKHKLIELVLAIFRPKFLELLAETRGIDIDNFYISAKDDDNTYNIFSCKSLAEQLKREYFPKNIDQLFKPDFLQSVLEYLQATNSPSLDIIRESITSLISKCTIPLHSGDEIRELIEIPDSEIDKKYGQAKSYNPNLNLSDLANIICHGKDEKPYYEIYFCFLVCGMIEAITTARIDISKISTRPVVAAATRNLQDMNGVQKQEPPVLATPRRPLVRKWQPTHPEIPVGTAAEVASMYPDDFGHEGDFKL